MLSESTKVKLALVNSGLLSLTSDRVTRRGIEVLRGDGERSIAVRVS